MCAHKEEAQTKIDQLIEAMRSLTEAILSRDTQMDRLMRDRYGIRPRVVGRT